jgi:hypothetical protein
MHLPPSQGGPLRLPLLEMLHGLLRSAVVGDRVEEEAHSSSGPACHSPPQGLWVPSTLLSTRGNELPFLRPRPVALTHKPGSSLFPAPVHGQALAPQAVPFLAHSQWHAQDLSAAPACRRARMAACIAGSAAVAALALCSAFSSAAR